METNYREIGLENTREYFPNQEINKQYILKMKNQNTEKSNKGRDLSDKTKEK